MKKQAVSKLDGDGNYEPTLYVNTKNKINFEGWSIDSEIDLTKPPAEWLESFGQWLLPYALGYDCTAGERADRSLIDADLPWVRGELWRPDVEVGEPPEHPLMFDISLEYEEGRNCMRARYDFRSMVMERAAHCMKDGSYLEDLKEMQAALRSLADELQAAIDGGAAIPE
jgi:hypothetical protein